MLKNMLFPVFLSCINMWEGNCSWFCFIQEELHGSQLVSEEEKHENSQDLMTRAHT